VKYILEIFQTENSGLSSNEIAKFGMYCTKTSSSPTTTGWPPPVSA